MKKEKIIYLILTLLFVVAIFVILRHTDLANNVALSKAIQIILIIYLTRVAYGCALYIQKQYKEKKLSYSIIMNLGLFLFIIINIFRMINLLIENWHVMNIIDIYNNTIESFSFFAMLTLPCIVILSIYGIITNIVLIKKEGFAPRHLLGIIIAVLALIGLLGSQTIYLYTYKLLVGKDQMVIKKLIDIVVNVTLTYFYTLIIASLYCNLRAAKHVPKYDKDFVIILGCRVRKDGSLTPLLKGRVDKAIEFANDQYKNTKKKIIYVPSGGKGTDECIAEAKAIEKYLIEKGIEKDRIIVEDKSTSTEENMKFSKDKIFKVKKDPNITIATTNYHVFRSLVIANNHGLKCEGIGSKTIWYYYTNALIREFVVNMFQERKKHIALILLMNITAVILVVIGYHFNLINLYLGN